MIGVATPTPNPEARVDADMDTLATALYARTDDVLKASPQLAPWRPEAGIEPQLSDAELVTLAVMQALLGYTSEARWLRHARKHLRDLFPYLPQQPGYNKRLRKTAGTIGVLIGVLARDTSLWTDDVWVVDSTPVECGRSRETARRSELAGWAEYGYCASHSRYFWGLRLHLPPTPHGLPLLRPARKGEPERAGSRFFKPLRQTVESIFDTCKDQTDLERHGGRTPEGVLVRVMQRILALTAAIWHNDRTGQPVKRSLIAYDHYPPLGIDHLDLSQPQAAADQAAASIHTQARSELACDAFHPAGTSSGSEVSGQGSP